jgi:hypothetical protein
MRNGDLSSWFLERTLQVPLARMRELYSGLGRVSSSASVGARRRFEDCIDDLDRALAAPQET